MDIVNAIKINKPEKIITSTSSESLNVKNFKKFKRKSDSSKQTEPIPMVIVSNNGLGANSKWLAEADKEKDEAEKADKLLEDIEKKGRRKTK